MAVQDWQSTWFQTKWWLLAYLAALLAGIGRLARCRGHHAGAFILCLVALVPLGAALVTCVVNIAIVRYSYPAQFIYYLSVALLPAAWSTAEIESPSKPGP